MPTAKLQYRPFEPGDEERILETFNLTFRQVCGQGYVDRGSAQWRWEYLDNPAGSLAYLAVTEQGQVAAQYAGVLMRVHLGAEDRDLVFMHAVDSMVHPDFRRGLKKRPLFLEIAEAYFETYGGKAFDLGFGYPVRPAWRIGERYLGYRKIRDLDFLLLDLAGAPATPAWSPRTAPTCSGATRPAPAPTTISSTPTKEARPAASPSSEPKAPSSPAPPPSATSSSTPKTRKPSPPSSARPRPSPAPTAAPSS